MQFHFQQYLNHWYRQPRLRPLIDAQAALLRNGLERAFGYYLVQLGAPWPDSPAAEVKVSTHVLVEARAHKQPPFETVVADFDQLPFARESVDVAVLPHSLETVSDPYHLLRQVDRMLVLDGYVGICGFNPFSLSNQRLRRVGRDRAVFRSANWIGMHRVVDWLNLLGYEIILAQHTALGWLPDGREGSRWSAWRERLEYGLEKTHLHTGRFYCVVAQKRSVPLTPTPLDWKLANWLPINKGAWVPSRRLQHRSAHEKS